MSRIFTYVEEAVARLGSDGLDDKVVFLETLTQENSRVAQIRFQRAGVSRKKAKIQCRARDVVARESGFADWNDFHNLALTEKLSTANAERAFVISAVVGNDQRCEEILKIHPSLAVASLAVRCCIGRVESSYITNEIKELNKGIGPFDWPPLLYLCASKYRNGDVSNRDSRQKLVAMLLASGADPNVGFYEHSTIRGYCTALGASIGYSKNTGITEALLSAGADLADGPTLYEGCAMWYAVNESDSASLQRLIDGNPPHWHLCHALPHCLAYLEFDMCRSLLEAGADPNWSMGAHGFGGNCLHEAVALDTPVEFVELLLDSGADLSFIDNAGRTPMTLAVALHRDSKQRYFSKKGGSISDSGAVEQWVAACMNEDDETARSLAPKASDTDPLRFEDHNWLHIFTENQSRKSIELLLDGGLDVNGLSYDGSRPIHRAITSRNVDAIRCLAVAGADLEALNFRGEAALDCWIANSTSDDTPRFLNVDDGAESPRDALLLEALNLDDDIAIRPPELLTLKDADVFEEAVDAVVAGDLATLTRILDEKPHFVRARSRRPHRCTLLNYIGVNGFEGERQRLAPNVIDVVNLLLERGSDPQAFSYTYRGGPGNNTIGLLTSSGHANESGLALKITHALVRAGANVSPEWRIFIDLYDHQINDSLDSFVQTLDPEDHLVAAAFRDAVSLQSKEIVAALLERGVNVNSANDQNVTALHAAAINDDQEMVELLLNAGADPRIRDLQWDGNAAGWAYAGEHPQLGERLEKLIRDMDR